MSSEPIRVVICEDEPLARETLRDFIAAQPGLLLIGEAANGREALRLIQALQPGRGALCRCRGARVGPAGGRLRARRSGGQRAAKRPG